MLLGSRAACVKITLRLSSYKRGDLTIANLESSLVVQAHCERLSNSHCSGFREKSLFPASFCWRVLAGSKEKHCKMAKISEDVTIGAFAVTSSSVARSKKKSAALEVARRFVAARKRAKREIPEKRLALYEPSPSSATRDRIARAFQHRLYLINKRLSGDPNSPSSCSFNVLGATGNVYEVKLQRQPYCSCPDFPRSGLCKHILFVMLRVLKVDRNDPRVWQKALLTSELRELLAISIVSDAVLASKSVRQRFDEIQDVGKYGKENVAPEAQQREIVGDCPICYERMDDGKGKAREPVVFCKACGNNVHEDCFDKWDRNEKLSTTCFYCPASWSEDSEDSEDSEEELGEYVNLADVSEAHKNQNLEDLYPEWTRYRGRWRRRRSGSY